MIYASHSWYPNFGPISVQSLLYTLDFLILSLYLSSVFHCAGDVCGQTPVDFFWSVAYDSARAMRRRVQGGRGHTGGEKKTRGCAREIVLARNLLRQAEARSWVTVRLPVPQGTGEASSAYHAGV